MMKMENFLNMMVLGIESSCDESAVAVLQVIANRDNNARTSFYENHAQDFCNVDKILKQYPLSIMVRQEMIATHNHKQYGGVIPESAARQHFYFLYEMIKSLFINEAEQDMNDTVKCVDDAQDNVDQDAVEQDNVEDNAQMVKSDENFDLSCHHISCTAGMCTDVCTDVCNSVENKLLPNKLDDGKKFVTSDMPNNIFVSDDISMKNSDNNLHKHNVASNVFSNVGLNVSSNVDLNVASNNIDYHYICSTYGPGLIGGLMLGTCVGKAVALALDKPFYPVHHIHAHAVSPMMENANLKFPYICFVVSGGHTSLIHIDGFNEKGILNATVIAQTRDDAMGEVFDKIAHYIGLGFPGGRKIEELAKNGNPHAYVFKLPKCRSITRGDMVLNDFDFSFSGLKTAVIRRITQILQQNQQSQFSDGGDMYKSNLDKSNLYKSMQSKNNNASIGLTYQQKCDIAASLQYTLAQVCAQKLDYIAKEYPDVKQWAIAGGVACNQTIRKSCLSIADKYDKEIFFPSLKLCTDNATMIAWLGLVSILHGQQPNPLQKVMSSI